MSIFSPQEVARITTEEELRVRREAELAEREAVRQGLAGAAPGSSAAPAATDRCTHLGRLLAAVQRHNADRRAARQRAIATGPLPPEFPIPPAPAA